MDDIAKLKAENERLKEEIKSLDRLQKLDHSYVIMYRNLLSKNVNKYKQTLQEIKTIAEENQFYFGAGTIVSYETIKQLATNFEKILDLINKAEEE